MFDKTRFTLFTVLFSLCIAGCTTMFSKPGNQTVELQRSPATWYKTESVSPSASHATIPLGTPVRVTNIKNGKQVIVTITNRIANSPDRILDISQVAAEHIEMNARGITMVTLEVMGGRRLTEKGGVALIVIPLRKVYRVNETFTLPDSFDAAYLRGAGGELTELLDVPGGIDSVNIYPPATPDTAVPVYPGEGSYTFLSPGIHQVFVTKTVGGETLTESYTVSVER